MAFVATRGGDAWATLVGTRYQPAELTRVLSPPSHFSLSDVC